METLSEPKSKIIIALNFTLIVLSVLMILIPSVAGLVLERSFAEHCICVVNLLSYAWIAYAICILINLKHLLIRFVRFRILEKCFKNVEKLMLILSMTAFIAGTVLFMIFTCRYLDVI